MKFSLQDKMRAGHVKRWQIVRVAREQNIAEHMYRVHLIVAEICERMGVSDHRQSNAVRWALMHDLPEVITGDIATPTKQAMRLAIPGKDPLRNVELSLDTDYRELYLNLKSYDPIALAIVKAADMIEAVDFLVTEAVGPHSVEVLVGIRKNLIAFINECQTKYPDHQWHHAMAVYSELTHSPEAREAVKGL